MGTKGVMMTTPPLIVCLLSDQQQDKHFTDGFWFNPRDIPKRCRPSKSPIQTSSQAHTGLIGTSGSRIPSWLQSWFSVSGSNMFPGCVCEQLSSEGQEVGRVPGHSAFRWEWRPCFQKVQGVSLLCDGFLSSKGMVDSIRCSQNGTKVVRTHWQVVLWAALWNWKNKNSVSVLNVMLEKESIL